MYLGFRYLMDISHEQAIQDILAYTDKYSREELEELRRSDILDLLKQQVRSWGIPT